ncbi:MAG: hypothetical protein FVQ83_06555 [Chloroflexi bacterium]|nr:hypothetical protein [Chloroflexota bacterium]
MKFESLRPYATRFLIILITATFFIAAVNEIVFLIQKEDTDRIPMEIELVIPEGTAELVALGEQVTGIPDEMVFVLGDVLVVRNQDVVSHELGPVFVPPESSASMRLDTADRYALSCSFNPSRYLGLNVKQPTNIWTRLTALLFAVPTTTIIVFIYSLAAKPIQQH